MENRSCQLTKLIEIIHCEPSDTCRLSKYTITPSGHNYISKLILNPFPSNRYLCESFCDEMAETFLQNAILKFKSEKQKGGGN